MKKVTILIVFALIGMLVSGTLVNADTISAGDRIMLVNGPGSPGGEFGIRKWTGTIYSGVLFETFCIQGTEYIDFNSEGFIVQSITDHTILGYDQISDATAYLYYQFRMGSLYDNIGNIYDGTTGTTASPNALQNAIWQLEDENWNSSVLEEFWYNQALNAVVDGWRNDGKVQVMNLVWATTRNGFREGTNAQDQLVLAPVPEPSTILLIGSGLIGFGILGRKRFKRRG